MAKRIDEHGNFLTVSGGGGGGKAGGSSTPTEAPNTLKAKSIARTLELVSEGPIKGLVDGNKSVYFNKVPFANADGGLNFEGIAYAFLNGEPDQEALEGFTDVTTSVAVSTEVTFGTPVTRRITNPDADTTVVTLSVPALSTLDTETGDLDGGRVDIAIYVKSDADAQGSTYVRRVRDIVQGKTTSTYERAYRIPLTGNGPWDIKMERLTADSSSSNIQNDTFFSRYSEIISHQISYQDSSVLATEVDSELFGSSPPTRAVEIYGLLINYPSNYDPDTRTYTGIWDGTFTFGYCNNPAWVLWDTLTNRKHGARIPEEYIDKWGFYEVAQYSDELVNDGFGGLEPRFTFNGTVQTREDAYKVIQSISSMMRSAAYFSTGLIRLSQDKPASPEKIFNQTNIIGEFNYSGTARSARHTVAQVQWVNPELDYESDIEVVENRAAILKYGYRALDLTAFGTTSRGQAHRQGKYVLATEELESEVVQFKFGMDSADLLPGQIILISDPTQTTAEVGGRNVGATQTTLSLDRVIDVDPSKNCFITFHLADGTPHTSAITSANQNTNVVTLTTPIPTSDLVPDALGSIWVMYNDDIEPKPFRVMEIEEEEAGEYKIVAVEYAEEKFNIVDNFLDIEAGENTYSNLANPSSIGPVTGLSLAFRSRYQDGRLRMFAELDWVQPIDEQVRGYVVSYQYENNNWVQLPEIQHSNVELTDILTGNYRFVVRAVNMFGIMSARSSIDGNFGGADASSEDPISNLRSELGNTNFEGPDCTVFWASGSIISDASDVTDGQDPFFKHFKVQVYNSAGTTLLRTETTKSTQWTYTYAMNEADNGTPQRTFQIRVSYVDIKDNESTALSQTFANPQAVNPLVTAEGQNGRITLSYPKPIHPDFVGLKVHASTTSGFTPSAGNLKWEGDGAPVWPASAGVIVYYKFAAYDSFGQDPLSYSNEQTVTPLAVSESDMPSSYPTALTGIAANASAIIDAQSDISDLETTFGSTQSAAQSAQDAADDAAEAAQDAADALIARVEAEAAETGAVEASGVSVGAARDLLPSTFENADLYFTSAVNGAPDEVADVLDHANASAINDATEGDGIRSTGRLGISSKGLLPYIPLDTYRLTVRAAKTVSGTNVASHRLQFRRLLGNYTHNGVDGLYITPLTATADDYVIEHTATQADYDAGIRHYRAEFLTNVGGDEEDTVDAYRLHIQNVSQEIRAAASASAAATSQSAAFVSETNAGQSAGAAALSETNASTSESNASVSEGNAATSESNAAGSASDAASSKTVAADAATDAEGFADDAEGHADDAEGFRNTASAAASAAASDASTASADANAAGQSATAAQLAETNAQTSESNAATSEGNAATSETNADGYANAAASSLSSVNAALELMEGTEGNYTPEPHLINTNRSSFTSSISGLSANNADLSSSIWPDVTDPDMGASVQSDGSDIIATKENYVIDSLDEWVVTYKYKAVTNNSGAQQYVRTFLRWLDDTGASLGAAILGDGPTYTVADGVQTQIVNINMSTLTPPANATSFKIYIFSNISGGDGLNNWSEFLVDNNNASGGTIGYVEAAANSAAAASAAETAAGQSASAASSSETNAATSEGNAATSETNASNSNTSAAGHASNASSSASLAATAVTDAEGFADDAEGHADDAEGFADAAVLAEGNASASATNAGQSATAAQTAETNAETAESNAGTSETNAATSATNAATSEAAAQSIKEVTAKIARSHLTDNSSFVNYDASVPDDWVNWRLDGTRSKVTGDISDNAVRDVIQLGDEQGMYQIHSGTIRQGWFVIEADVVLEAGTFIGSGVFASIRNSSGTEVSGSLLQHFHAYTDPSTGALTGTGTVGRRYYFRMLHHFSHADSHLLYLYGMTGYNSLAATPAAKTLQWNELGIRPATAQEVEAEKVASLEATATVTQSAVASIEDQLAAASVVIESQVTSSIARIEVSAANASGTPYSGIYMLMDRLEIVNDIDGTPTTAMTVTGGNVKVFGDLEVGSQIFLASGGGRWPLALQNAEYSLQDGDVVAFGLDIGDYEVAFSSLGLDPLATDEAYRLRAISKSGTGFTAELKVVTPGGTTSVTQSTNATSPAGPDQMVAKAETADSYNDKYAFYASGSMSIFVFNEGGGVYEYSSIGVALTWFHDGSSWVEGPTIGFTHNEVGINPTHTSGTQTYSFSNKQIGQATFTGTIRDSASAATFGLDEGGDFTITNLNSVRFSKQTQSGERSATPSGEVCTTLVSPKNVVS